MKIFLALLTKKIPMTVQTLPPPSSRVVHPPFRFTYVQDDLMRGGWIKAKNIPFFTPKHLKCILTLAKDPLDLAVQKWAQKHQIQLLCVKVDKSKEESVPLSFTKMNQILALMIDAANHPMYFHCLDGTITTNCVTACLRKLQGYPIELILEEAHRNTKDLTMGKEERDFIMSYPGDFEIGANLLQRLPSWLWNGIPLLKKHGQLKVRMAATPTATPTQDREMAAVPLSPLLSGGNQILTMGGTGSVTVLTSSVSQANLKRGDSGFGKQPDNVTGSTVGLVASTNGTIVLEEFALGGNGAAEGAGMERAGSTNPPKDESEGDYLSLPRLSRTIIALDLEMGSREGRN